MDAEAWLEELETDLVEKWSQIFSLRCKIDGTNEDPPFEGRPRQCIPFTGVLQYRKLQGIESFRSEMTFERKSKEGSSSYTFQGLEVFDGQCAYCETRVANEILLINKIPGNVHTRNPIPSATLLTAIHEAGRVSRLQDCEIRGEEVYVLQVELRNPFRFKVLENFSEIYSFSKETGVLVRVVHLDSKQRKVNVTDYCEIEINLEKPEEPFTYEIPEGAEVTEISPE